MKLSVAIAAGASRPGCTQAHENDSLAWHGRYLNRHHYRYRLLRRQFSIAMPIPTANALFGFLFSEQFFMRLGAHLVTHEKVGPVRRTGPTDDAILEAVSHAPGAHPSA
jgi:hypothetical protein